MNACRDDGIYPPQYDVSSSDITVEFIAPEERLIRTNGRIKGSNESGLIDKNSTQTEDEPNYARDERSLSGVLSH